MNKPEPAYGILAIGAHPDDAELFAGGTLLRAAAAGHRVAILSLTRGESGTAGSAGQRAQEAAVAAKILGVAHSEQLDLGDGRLMNDETRRDAVVAAIRRLRPRVVLSHGPVDRHPDHRATHELVRDALFLANVAGYAPEGQAASERWKTEACVWWAGNTMDPQPRADWVVDISEFFERKMQALKAYSTQFNHPAGKAQTYIGTAEFWEQLERRSKMWGHFTSVQYGEPFYFDCPAHANHPLIALTR